ASAEPAAEESSTTLWEIVPPTTEAPTTTAPPEPTTTAPTTTTAPPPPARPGAWTVGPYQGTGVWIDVYDWTTTIAGNPRVGIEQIDQMADLGIQTIYIQTAHRRSPADVIEPERLLPMIDRAHARGMAVVAWYLPELVDTTYDLHKLLAAAALPVDGLGVDIESTAIGDPAERTRRLIELSQGLRRNVGTKAISAITLDAVHLQVVNPRFWPTFPWPELGQLYDVIVPMAYWSVRKAEWRAGDRYIFENIDRIRAATGRPDIPIHVAGGIADGISLDDVAGMIHAIHMRGAIGGSLYDWNTSNAEQWNLLRALRVG
ncbi:MAG TPA: hypothetical protein VJ804_09380, partial [Acidimicrobiales bacterium]|nr:hypothetical protein [Acidimicrobiales bacterium]